jgi:GNAT superfamily N-acetyltransferase
MAKNASSAVADGPTVKARRLAAQDLDAVVAIDAALAGRTRRAYFERRLQAAQRSPALHAQFGIDRDGALAGYVFGRVLEGEFGRAPALRLEVIGVRPEARGKGLGAALSRAIEDEARKLGLREMRTGAHWRNHTMLRYLDRAGYELSEHSVIDCAVVGANLGSAREEPVTLPLHERPSDQHDYSDTASNDFETLARDTADIRSLSLADLEDVVRIDRRLTGRERGVYMRHKIEDAMNDTAIRLSLIARKDKTAAGFLTASADYGDFGRTEPVAILDTIGVDPNFAHSGIARALFSQLFINLRALQIERIETVVAKENYELLGFLYHEGFGPSPRLSFVKRLG